MTVSIEHVKIKHVYIQTEYRVHNTGDMSCEHTVMDNKATLCINLYLNTHLYYNTMLVLLYLYPHI